jgi:hypothetical protein
MEETLELLGQNGLLKDLLPVEDLVRVEERVQELLVYKRGSAGEAPCILY